MSYIDIAIIALVVIMGLVGLWKGFFKTFIGMFGGVIALLLAIFLAKPVAEACIDGFARNFVLGESSIYSFVYNLLPEAVKNLGAPSGVTEEMIGQALGTGAFGWLLKPFAGMFIGSEIVASSATVAQGIGVLLAYGIFTVIVGIALFIIARLVMTLFTMFAKSFSRGGKPSGLSRLLGMVLGAARGALYACVLLLMASFLTGFPGMAGYNAELEKSVIAKPVNEYVIKIPEKLFNDGDLFNKLLDRAGFSVSDKGDEEQPETHTMTQVEEALKGDFEDLLNPDRTAHLYGNKYDAYIRALSDYNNAAASKIAAEGIGAGETEQQKGAALHALLSIGEGEARSDLYAAYVSLTANVSVYNGSYADLDEGQKAEREAAIEAALATIRAQYGSSGITALFGELVYPSENA